MSVQCPAVISLSQDKSTCKPLLLLYMLSFLDVVVESYSQYLINIDKWTLNSFHCASQYNVGYSVSVSPRIVLSAYTMPSRDKWLCNASNDTQSSSDLWHFWKAGVPWKGWTRATVTATGSRQYTYGVCNRVMLRLTQHIIIQRYSVICSLTVLPPGWY